jgi:magnesium-protoporphyrin IX monomethyl ester (oxidative) cyclase
MVGLSSIFQQTCASIAIANMMKTFDSDIITVLGGGNCLRPMGDEIARITPNFDYIFAGEGDFHFPEFCKNYLSSKSLPTNKVIECLPVFEMDKLPIPDFDDYFTQMEEMGLKTNFTHIPFESSSLYWISINRIL